MKKEKIIITYGTFDTFHYGHLKILERAKKLGTKLIVGISTDEFNKIKEKQSLISFKERKEIIKSIKFVDEVIDEKNWNQKINDIKKYKVDLLVMGSDWKNSKEFNKLKNICKIKFLQRTKNISSTNKRSIFKILNEKSINNLEESLNLLKQIKNNFK